jgi:hypothetical protein
MLDSRNDEIARFTSRLIIACEGGTTISSGPVRAMQNGAICIGESEDDPETPPEPTPPDPEPESIAHRSQCRLSHREEAAKWNRRQWIESDTSNPPRLTGSLEIIGNAPDSSV